MKAITLCVMTVVLLVAAPPREEAAKKDLEKLQGAWVVEGITVVEDGNGAGLAEDLGKLTFSESTFTWALASIPRGFPVKLPREQEGSFTIGSSRGLKTIEIKSSGGTRKGVYSLEGDKLRIRFNKTEGEGKEDYPETGPDKNCPNTFVLLLVRKK